MSRGYPSLTALLGILAVAGYQNREKLAEIFGSAHNPRLNSSVENRRGSPDLLSHQSPSGAAPPANDAISRLTAGVGSAGALLANGLAELVERFSASGQGDTVDTWIKTGPNRPASTAQIETAIGPDVLDTLVSTTGLSRAEVVTRLTRDLPAAVDSYTPDGMIPRQPARV